jgi:hypothetical protein
MCNMKRFSASFNICPTQSVAYDGQLFPGRYIGDFVLINYYWKNRYRVIYTYDDIDVERKTYFFEEKSIL